MQLILVWTLVIAAIAIVGMLFLLLASERDAERNRLEAEWLRTTLESTSAAARARANARLDDGPAISSERSKRTEEARANEVAIAAMQCELEALRAENVWLKQQSAACPAESSGLESTIPGSNPIPPVEQAGARAADRLDPGRRNRPMLPALAVSLSLVALFSVYIFARNTTTFTAQPIESRGAALLQADFATLGTGDADDAKSHPQMTSKTTAPKKSAAPAAATSYEVVRSTRVFSEPHESSRPLARAEAGMEINVIGARKDWLEVRSRHGRPPGFIRKDTVIEKSGR